MIENIAVTGDGSWATALVKVLTNNGIFVNWHIRTPEILESVQKKGINPNYLSSVKLDTTKLTCYSNLEDVLKNCNYLFVVIPSAFVESVFKDIPQPLMANVNIVSATKGILPNLHVTPSVFYSQYFNLPNNQLFVVSGPHAEEIAANKLTSLTVLSQNIDKTKFISDLLKNDYIYTDTSNDILGVEYATVLKNIMALSVGIAHGLGHGDNFVSVLVSAAAREMETFLHTISPINRNFFHPVYLGDLLVTCYSQFSRNRTFGNMIGKGYSVTSAQLELNMIAEGYYAIAGLMPIIEKFNIPMPISQSVYNILYKKANPKDEYEQLICKLH